MISLVCAYELDSVAKKMDIHHFVRRVKHAFIEGCFEILGNIRLPLLLGCHISIETVLRFGPRTKINNNMCFRNYHPSNEFYNKLASRKKMFLLNIR